MAWVGKNVQRSVRTDMDENVTDGQDGLQMQLIQYFPRGGGERSKVLWLVASVFERRMVRMRIKEWDKERLDQKQQKYVPLSGGAEDVAHARVAIQKLERRKKTQRTRLTQRSSHSRTGLSFRDIPV